MNKIVILSDIHANLTAIKAVLKHAGTQYDPDAYVLLGDVINYGMRPNEVIDELRNLPVPVAVNLMGNHEKALLDGDTVHFSTERGKQLLEYTSSILTEDSLRYIRREMTGEAVKENWQGKNFLFVHGDKNDCFWGKLRADKVSDEYYSNYDYVISGHTHLPHYIEHFYSVDCPRLRNKKKTIFINPGSVGQPRNQNPCAQYVYLELSTGTIHYNSVTYDIEAERRLYPDSLDPFYKERLLSGI